MLKAHASRRRTTQEIKDQKAAEELEKQQTAAKLAQVAALQ